MTITRLRWGSSALRILVRTQLFEQGLDPRATGIVEIEKVGYNRTEAGILIKRSKGNRGIDR